MTQRPDIVIVGGGMAGLTAAAFLARARYQVTLIEQSSEVGGRARTQRSKDFLFNQGAHALYLGGNGKKILDNLGVLFSGGVPTEPNRVTQNATIYQSPDKQPDTGLPNLLSDSSRNDYDKFVQSVPEIDTEELQGVSLKKWLDEKINDVDVISYLHTLFRLTTYSNDPDVASAGATLRQLQVAFSNVLYLDGGWQTLVDGLSKKATSLGAKIISDRAVNSVEFDDTVKGVTLHSGETIDAQVIIMATPPEATTRLLGNKIKGLSEFTKDAIPVRAACLDVALTELPQKDNFYVLGFDKPFYLSVHSKYAKLTPNRGHLLHVVKYLSRNDGNNFAKVQSELEEYLDLLQPGWKKFVVRKRFLPNMTVSNAVVTASHGGVHGRPSTRVSDVKNLYVVGDWIGTEGMLVDASISSARQASEMIMEQSIRVQ